MKAHQTTQQSALIKPSELFFGVLMLIIILMTSCNTSQASPKVSLENSYTEQTQTENTTSTHPKFDDEVKIQRLQGTVSVPALVLLLLIFSYGILNGSLYLVKELKK